MRVESHKYVTVQLIIAISGYSEQGSIEPAGIEVLPSFDSQDDSKGAIRPLCVPGACMVKTVTLGVDEPAVIDVQRKSQGQKNRQSSRTPIT